MCDTCPTPFKQAFTDKADANAALNRQAPERGRKATKVYKCPCGYWHLSGPRRAVSEETRKRNHRRKGGAKRRTRRPRRQPIY